MATKNRKECCTLSGGVKRGEQNACPDPLDHINKPLAAFSTEKCDCPITRAGLSMGE